MAKSGNRQSADETLGQVWEVGVFVSCNKTCTFYEHILNDLVIIKAFYFLLRLLLCYLCLTNLFNLFISLKSFMFGTCMRNYFVSLCNSAKTNCVVSKNEAEENSFLIFFLEKLCNSHIYKQKRIFAFY